MAAWGVFLLLASGLVGYVVAFSEHPAPQEAVAEQPATQEESDTEQATAPEASEDTASPEAESSEQPAAEAASDAAEATPLPGETDEPADSASDETAPDVMQPAAATDEVNGQATELASQTPPSEQISETPEPPAPPQATEQESPPADFEAETAANEAPTEEPGREPAPEPAQEAVQQAFRAPEPPRADQTVDEAAPAWQRFSAYFLEEDSRPRVAIVMTGLGMSEGVTEAAIRSLPPEVSLSFSPYAHNLANWIGLARVNGHEVLLDLYMEPSTYPFDDPGPQAIMTVLSEAENRKRFDWVLSRGNSFVGLTGRMGSRLLARQESLSPVLEDIAEQGLLFVDDRSTAASLGFDLARQLDVPAAYSEDMIDEPSANRAAIDAKLNRVERLALTKGAAVALAQPYPVTIERLNVWIAELAERGVVLAPISAVVNRQPPPG